MAQYAWLFIIAGGAALLGFALIFGSIKQDGKRSIIPITGAVVVGIFALLLGIFISRAPTAPIIASDPQASEISRPARQSDQNALPGLQQPNQR
ncbi:hypothetical protein [Rhizobium terrae]|uniref:hypothetical protein n=1 Tax=Rhizobium terrae TaxID=2171756 RepID=UPI000E3DB7E5|nr:hypothetical protein [Rhizobium terrae]